MGYTRGIRWTDEKIESKINEARKLLGIERMPSASEIEMIFQNSSLSSKISRSGGFYLWANKLGLEIKKGETFTGKCGETEAKRLIEEKGYATQCMSTKYPFDLLVNDKIRIDVKVARPHYIKNSRCHTVGINKKYATCDFYFIFAMDESDKIEKIFIIPGFNLRCTSMNFGKESLYNIYLDRWDLLEEYNNFCNKQASIRNQMKRR